MYCGVHLHKLLHLKNWMKCTKLFTVIYPLKDNFFFFIFKKKKINNKRMEHDIDTNLATRESMFNVQCQSD